MTPKSFKLTGDGFLTVVWSNGLEVPFPLQFLRDQCPCAGCKGEPGLFGVHYQPVQIPIMKPGMYELKKVQLVGNYAVQLAWGDGHDTGIYSWNYLADLTAKWKAKKN